MKVFFITLLLMLSVSSTACAFEVQIDGLWYDLNPETKEAEVINCQDDNSYSGEISIPMSLKHQKTTYTITGIGSMAFTDCRDLTSVVISNSVKSIGEYAFEGCTGLASVSLGNSIIRISHGAFKNCINLTTVTLDNNALVSQDRTLSTSLSNVFGRQVDTYIIGDDVTAIGEYTFAHCPKLTYATIGNSVMNIGAHAFEGCPKLSSLTIGKSVKDIGASAFAGCYSLFSVNIPDSVERIHSFAFSLCANLSELSIGQSVKEIQKRAFSGCHKLSTVTINSNALVSQDRTAATSLNILFSTCDSIIKETSYSDIHSLAEKFGQDMVEKIVQQFEVKTNRDQLNLQRIFTLITLQSEVKTYIIGDNVSHIGNNTFANSTKLTTVIMGNSVTRIGDGAFQGCSALKSIDFSKYTTSIGAMAFSDCSDLSSVTIPDRVTFIGTSAFANCKSLISVTLPYSLRNINGIGYNVFEGCDKLKHIYSNIRNPFSVKEDVFEYVYKAKLHVPAGTKKLYQSADGWKQFSKIVEFDAK